MALAFANIWSTRHKVAFTATNTAGAPDTGSILTATLVAAAPARSPILALLSASRANQAAASAAVGQDTATDAALRGKITVLHRTGAVAADTTVRANVAAPNTPLQLDVAMANDGVDIIIVERLHTTGR